jgi:hypothetical protein
MGGSRLARLAKLKVTLLFVFGGHKGHRGQAG